MISAMDHFRATNLECWEERADVHAASPDYDVDLLATDPDLLSEVVRFDRPRLGAIEGLDVVHLQCHIGTDTVSLAKLGAVGHGAGLLADALAQARDLAERAGPRRPLRRIGAVRGAAALGTTYDLVYTGVGALNWLPDIAGWATVVAALLRPGGRLHLREGHPMLWSLEDPRPDGLLSVEYPYFEVAQPSTFDEPGTYVTTDHEFVHNRTYEWNHGLGQIVTAVLDAGLSLTMLVEHDSVPWDALPGMMEHLGEGEFRLRDRPARLPHTYTLQAVKPR